jgi:hypothetical protein
MLLGIHDVDAFAESLITGAHFRTEYRTTLNLIEAIEGGREAALDVSFPIQYSPFIIHLH